jgi:hypothetical protein
MTWEQVVFELVKLAIQAAGAIFVARLAVRWALNRYKEEKTWERQLTAYADVLAALGEMRLINGKWADEVEGGASYTPEYKQMHQERYRAARRKFDEALAVASLVLPKPTNVLLHKLDRNLAGVTYEDIWDAYNQEYSLIDDALAELTAQGRDALGFTKLRNGKAKGKNASVTPVETSANPTI